MALFFRALAAIAVTTLLIWRLWLVAAQPVNASLSRQYVELARVQMDQNDWSAARATLRRAQALNPTNNDPALLEQTISQIENSVLIERDYLQSRGLDERLALLEIALREYPTPKEMLVEAARLIEQGELRYAELLLQRAEQLNPGYTGLSEIREIMVANEE